MNAGKLGVGNLLFTEIQKVFDVVFFPGLHIFTNINRQIIFR
jgi:hypothetical protein